MNEARGASRRAAWIQLVGLALTVCLWFVAEHLRLKVVALAVFVAAWTTWFLMRARRDPDLWRHWGLVVTGWRYDVVRYGTVFAGGVALVALLAFVLGRFALPSTLWLLLLAYPPWALVQQFALQNAIVDSARTIGVRRAFLPLIGAVAFGLAHLPDVPLAVLTAVGGFAWTWLFLHRRNLWLLALVHAVVGTLAFVWVLGRSPLEEFPELGRLVGP